MNGRKLTRGIIRAAILGVAVALSACATAPPPQELSILDAVADQHSSMGRQSCAALNAATVCVKSTRLDQNKKCGCADRQAITDGTVFQF
jgi:hypothetical protein